MNERVYNKEIERLRNPERIERLELAKVIEICINGKEIHSVLDIGTGSGVFAEGFHNYGINVVGIDINSEMIEFSRKLLPDIKFLKAASENLPFKDNTFDISFFGVVFHEVDDYNKSLNECYRVTNQSVYILEWYYEEQDFGPPLEHRLKPEFIKNEAMKAGFISFEEIHLSNLVLFKLVKYSN